MYWWGEALGWGQPPSNKPEKLKRPSSKIPRIDLKNPTTRAKLDQLLKGTPK